MEVKGKNYAEIWIKEQACQVGPAKFHFAPVWLSNTSNAHITACQQTLLHLCSWAECISSVFTWQSISKIGPSKAANPASLAGKDKRLVCQKCSQDMPHFLQSFAQANLQETSSLSFMLFSIFIFIQSSNVWFIVTCVCFTKTKPGVHANLSTYGMNRTWTSTYKNLSCLFFLSPGCFVQWGQWGEIITSTGHCKTLC